MNYLSVCSGIEAATVAWHEMGWNPIAFSEIEKFPSQVLAHHYPNVPNLGDMKKYKEWWTDTRWTSIGLPSLSFLENHSHRTLSPWCSVEKYLTVGRNIHPNSIVGFKFVPNKGQAQYHYRHCIDESLATVSPNICKRLQKFLKIIIYCIIIV